MVCAPVAFWETRWSITKAIYACNRPLEAGSGARRSAHPHTLACPPARRSSISSFFGQAGKRRPAPLSLSLTKRLEGEDCTQNGAQDDIFATREAAILIAAVEAIFIASTKTFAEVVVVVVPLYVVATIAVVGVSKGIRVFKAEIPAILPVCLSGAEALRIAVVHGLPEQIDTVLVRLVVRAATVVAIAVRRVEVRIAIVIVLTRET